MLPILLGISPKFDSIVETGIAKYQTKNVVRIIAKIEPGILEISLFEYNETTIVNNPIAME